MIYHFTGNSETLVKQQVRAWKDMFIKKYGDFNLVHIKDIYNISKINIAESLTAMSFLAEKKLIIVDLVFSKKIIEDENDQNDDEKDVESYIIKLFPNIPEDNIVLFNSVNPDKRSKIYKELSKIAEVKDFSVDENNSTKSIIEKKYAAKISSKAIDLLTRYKSSNLGKIISEIDKLLITFEQIDESHIKEYIYPELEESIFLFIGDLLDLRLTEAFKKLDIILENTNVYAFYNNFLANIRPQVFINKLKKQGLSQKDIGEILKLGNRAFLITKTYKINPIKLENMYLQLIDLDKKMKTGNMIGSDEIDIKYEIEKVLLGVV